jgi:hypothetical protein
MTTTGTQNRPYPNTKFLVRAIFTFKDGVRQEHLFDWNDRASVRNFAAQSDRILRDGGKTLLEPVEEPREKLAREHGCKRECRECRYSGMDMDLQPYCGHPAVLKRMPHGQVLWQGIEECPGPSHPLWEARTD